MMLRWVVLACILGLQSCNYVNDFWLGKDNTPKPGPLAPITQKAAFKSCWTVPVGRSHHKKHSYIRLKPTVSGQNVYAATEDGSVKAVNRATGRVAWSQSLKTSLVSGPEVGAGLVAVSTDHASVIALKQSNGDKLWEASTSGEILSTPLITDGKVIVKTVDGRLYAFDAKNGEKIWVVDHGSTAFVLRASSSPKRYGRMILAGFSDGKLDAVDLDTGHVAWQRSMGYVSGSSDVDRLVDISTDPLVRNNTVYLASYQGYLVAMALRQGEFLWNKPVSTYRNLDTSGDWLYMTDVHDVIWSVNRHNGKVGWKQPILEARRVTTPVVMGRYLVAGDRQGTLHLFEKRNGEAVGRTQLDGAIVADPEVDADGHVYVMTATGTLQCFSAKDVSRS